MNGGVYFILMALLYNTQLLSQTAPTRPKAITFSGNERFSNEVTIRDVYGQPFKNSYAEVKGSPYFVDDWLASSVTLANGAKAEKIPARLDLVAQELHFTSVDKQDWVFYSQFIKEVEFADSLSGNNFKFITGLPAIDNQKQSNFYLVLSEGPMSLLKSIRKVISVTKDDISGEIDKKFDVYEDLYLFDGKEIKRVRKERQFILTVLSGKKAQIETFLKTNSINFKNTQDIVKLFEFYNSL